jgi:glycosyltransferase involved in cell wall biosynthesis
LEEKDSLLEDVKVRIFSIKPNILWRTPLLMIETQLRNQFKRLEFDPDVLLAFSPYYINPARKIWPQLKIVFIFPCLLYKCLQSLPDCLGSNLLLSKFNFFLLRRCEANAIRLSHKVIVPSKTIASELEAFLGLMPKNVIVGGNGIDQKKADNSSSKQNLRVVYNMPMNSCIFLTVGHLDKNKNISKLVYAFSKIKNKGAILWIVGNGPEEENIKKLIKDLELNSRVFMFGYMKNIFNIYKAADALLHAARYEAFANVFLEAMIMGLPVIGPTNGICGVTSSLHEIIEDGVQGYLYQYDDESRLVRIIDEVASNFDLRKRLGGAARERILDQFTIEKYLTIIENQIVDSQYV